jgi:hypothetical protein
MTLIKDPAGILDSDAHRRVLAHLSTPGSDYGWSVDALVTSRMAGDYSLQHHHLPEGATKPVPDPDADPPATVLQGILDWAVQNGFAEKSSAGAYRQTPAGHALLAQEPIDPGTPGPAAIDSHTASSGSATAWDNAPTEPETTETPDA